MVQLLEKRFSSYNHLNRSAVYVTPMETEPNTLVEAKHSYATPSEAKPAEAKPAEVKLVNVSVRDENTALNLMVSFLSIAQKRGAFTFDESAKIWECISMFLKNGPPSTEGASASDANTLVFA